LALALKSSPASIADVPFPGIQDAGLQANSVAGPQSDSVSPVAAHLGVLKDFLREQEVNYLNRALAFTGGNKEKAAELLGVSLATLYRKLAGEGGN
jgi:DNA-binding NtrC family response regulator